MPRLRSPVALPPDQLAITQGFNAPVNYSRLNANRIQAHEGVDFAPRGAARDMARIPVVAVQNATVTSVRRQSGGYGNYVTIRFDDGRYGALYGHLQDVLVQAGQHLSEGDPIGTMGSTGRSTGRHLHFNLLDLSAGRGNYIYPQVIDPTPFLEIGTSLLQQVNNQPVQNIQHNQYPPQSLTGVGGKRRSKPITEQVIPRRVLLQGDYPPDMPAANNPNVGMTNRFFPPRSFYPPSMGQQIQTRMEQGLPPLFQTAPVSSPTLGMYSPESVGSSVQGIAEGAAGVPSAILQGIFAQGLQPDGTFDLLQAITGKSGDEREQYVQEKAPYVVLAIVLVLLFVLGALRLVFGSKS